MKSSPNHPICRLRDAKAENVEHLRSVVLREVMVVLRGGFGVAVILHAQTTAAGEHLPGVIAADFFVYAVGGCARSSEIHQVDQGTSVSCQGDAFLPHLGVASGKRGRGMGKMCHNLEERRSCKQKEVLARDISR